MRSFLLFRYLPKGGGPFDEAGGYGSGSALSTFEVSFSVPTAGYFVLSTSNFFVAQSTEHVLTPNLNVTITSLQNGLIGSMNDSTLFNSVKGALTAGDVYTLQESLSISGSTSDPSGDMSSMSMDIRLIVIPKLNIQSNGNDSVLLYWAAGQSSLVLQENLNPATTNWVTSTNAVVESGGQDRVVIQNPIGSRFYRLAIE